MRHSIFFTLACSLLLTGNVWAALPSGSGGSGLIVTRTPDVLLRNAWNASAFFNYTGHSAPSSYNGSYASGYSRDWSDAGISGIFNFGFINNLEGGLVFPIDISGGPKSEGGIKDINILGKYKFLNGKTSPISLAATMVIGIPSASKSQVLGSGNANVSVEADLGYQAGKSIKNMLYANLGFKEGDYFSKAQPLKGYSLAPILFASLSYEYAVLLEKAYLSVELVGRSVLGKAGSSSSEIIPIGDEDLYALFGFRYLPTPVTALSLGLGGGIPDPMRTDTNYMATFGFSYLFNVAKSAARGFIYKKRTAPVKPVSVTHGLKVVVVNGCATSNKAQFFARKIKAAGYNVVRVGRAPRLIYNASIVIFSNPYYKQAVTILRLIPGSEKLARSKTKNSTYGIYVVIGCSSVK